MQARRNLGVVRPGVFVTLVTSVERDWFLRGSIDSGVLGWE